MKSWNTLISTTVLLALYCVNGRAIGGEVQVDSARVLWVREVNVGSATSSDVIAAMTTDAQGNSYVTGRTETPHGLVDFLTIKYSPLGSKLWSVLFDGSAGGNDVPTALAVAENGCVYVSGSSALPNSTSNTLVTVKYSANGEQQWLATYSAGSEHTTVNAQTVVPDNHGNVIVHGVVHVVFRRPMHVIIKYGESGNIVWTIEDSSVVATWPANAGLRIVGDSFGNTYIAQTISDSITSGSTNCRISKIDPAGSLVWERTVWSNDIGVGLLSDVALDRNENLIVAAYYSDRIMLVKLNPNGAVLWESSDVSVQGLFVRTDILNNIYIVHSDLQGFGYSLSKFSEWGAFQWRCHLQSSAFGFWPSASFATTQEGNVYVAVRRAGYHEQDSIVVMSLNPDGDIRWRESARIAPMWGSAPVFVSADSGGDVRVAYTAGSHQNSDYVLEKRGPDGLLQWRQRENGLGSPSDGAIYAMRQDLNGNIFFAGVARREGTGFDLFVGKMTPFGEVAWTATYDGPANRYDLCYNLELDPEGNILVAGTSANANYTAEQDYVLLKYDCNGTRLWTQRVELAGRVQDLVVDHSGRSYVAGLGGLHVFDAQGVGLWNTNEPAYAVAVKPDGAVFVAENAGIVRYDSPGSTVLIPASGRWFRDVVVDDSGFVYASSQMDSDTKVARYSPNGLLLWQGWGELNLSRDAAGNLYTYTYLLARYEKISGVRSYIIAGNIDGEPAFTVDEAGNAYSSGHKWGLERPHLYTVKYDTSGSQLWSLETEFDGWFSMRPYVLRAEPGGDLYIAGTAERRDLSRAIVLVKIDLHPVSVDEDKGAVPVAFQLFQNYPNPFNPSTTIVYSLPVGGKVTMKVHDVLGREVTSVVDEWQGAGNHKVVFDGSSLASGVYLLRLQSGGATRTMKVMLLR